MLEFFQKLTLSAKLFGLLLFLLVATLRLHFFNGNFLLLPKVSSFIHNREATITNFVEELVLLVYVLMVGISSYSLDIICLSLRNAELTEASLDLIHTILQRLHLFLWYPLSISYRMIIYILY